MIAISLSNTTLILGARALFRNLNWEIQHNQKIGLIGPNGAGKSSLLKLMTGEYTSEPNGAIIKAKGVAIGYLPQHPEFAPDKTAFVLALEGNPRAAQVDAELNLVETRLSDPAVYNNPKALDRALEAQQKLLDEYEALGGASYPARVRELLRGLGLPESDFDKPVGLLSGGQKKLIGLARLLLLKPSVLLLDEPDNHLDLPAKAYLERLIVDYPGAVVLVSHDRYLLDAVVTDIAEIEDGRLSTFPGNYTEYIVDKEQRLARQEDLYQVQQREISRLQMAARRYREWVAVSDKFASRLRAMQARIERIKEIEQPVLERRPMGLELNGWRGSNQVLELTGISKAFKTSSTDDADYTDEVPAGYKKENLRKSAQSADKKVVLNNVSFLLRHGERVGLIGANGAGKSVLLRLILGKETPDCGEIKIGPSVKIGYYAQEHETLDFDQTLIESARRAGNLGEANAVALLIRYLFTYQQAAQKIGSLSGGERSRLQLALLVLSGANFLLLDEPTNNLDIAAAEVLENALDSFNGTALIISHDRYFLDRTVSRILELKDGKLTEYLGGYSDYVEQTGSLKVES
ncbi:MAG: ABC-F family ATP-binding cassette domain-containing protein [Anaerolineales bacterium]